MLSFSKCIPLRFREQGFSATLFLSHNNYFLNTKISIKNRENSEKPLATLTEQMLHVLADALVEARWFCWYILLLQKE